MAHLNKVITFATYNADLFIVRHTELINVLKRKYLLQRLLFQTNSIPEQSSFPQKIFLA